MDLSNKLKFYTLLIPLLSFYMACENKSEYVATFYEYQYFPMMHDDSIKIAMPFKIDTAYLPLWYCGNSPRCKILEKEKMTIEICHTQVKKSYLNYSQNDHRKKEIQFQNEVEKQSKIYNHKVKSKALFKPKKTDLLDTWVVGGFELISQTEANSIYLNACKCKNSQLKEHLADCITIKQYVGKANYERAKLMADFNYIYENAIY